MGRTIVKRHNTQAATITRLSEKMRSQLYTTKTERILNGNSAEGSDMETLLLFRSNEEYMEYLKDWYFVRSLVDSFKNPIAEIIQKTPFRVNINDSKCSHLEDKINYRLAQSDLKNEIMDSLFDIIYYGRFFRVVIPTKDGNLKLTKVSDETLVDHAYQLNSHIGYIVNPGPDSKFIIRSKAIGAAFSFRNVEYKTMEELDPEILEELNKKLDLGSVQDGLTDLIIGLETRTPSSAFYDQAGLLFKMYINEMLQQFASLRDTFKQNLLALTLKDDSKNTIESSRVVQSIESVVNQDSSVLYNQSVQGLIQQMIFKTFNDTRVLPSVEAYSNIELVKWNDRSLDREKLAQEYNDLKIHALSALGIPDELFGNQANRWEILSKSDRYLSTTSIYLTLIADTVKSATQAFILAEGYTIELDDIDFSFKNDTDIQSQLSKHKVEIASDSISRLYNMINNFQLVISTGFTDVDKAVEEFVNVLIDSGAPFARSLADKDQILAFLTGASGEE